MIFSKIKRLFKKFSTKKADSKKNLAAIYPFIPHTRNHISPSHPNKVTDAWMKAIQDVSIKNARPGKFYMITGAYGPEHPEYACRWVVDEADKVDIETTNNTVRLISYRHKQRPYALGTGVHKIILVPPHPDHAGMEIEITLNTDVLPKVMFRARSTSDTGFAYIIDPAKYVLRPTL